MSGNQEKPPQISRRHVFKAMATFVGGAVAIASGRAAAQETKFSKEDSDYQDEPKDNETCEYCALFIAPHGCTVVEGEVSPKGWCKYWASI